MTTYEDRAVIKDFPDYSVSMDGKIKLNKAWSWLK